MISEKSIALSLDGQVAAIPEAIEGYGNINNDKIMKKYFDLKEKAVDIKSTDEITNFATLKAVVEDMQKNKDALGIKGVFSSTSMAAGNQWRWQTHTVNVPLFFEFYNQDPTANPVVTGLNDKTITFEYGKNYQNIMDLYVNNSVIAKTLLDSKTVDDAMAEFALEHSAMVQNGNWAAGQILGTTGNKV